MTVSSVTLGSNQSTFSGSVADITGLVLAVDANSLYRIEFWYSYSTSNSGNDPAIGFVGPTGSFVKLDTLYVADSSPYVASSALSVGNSNTAVSVLENSEVITALGAYAVGLIKTAGTSGNLQAQFESESAGATTTVYAGSLLALTKIG